MIFAVSVIIYKAYMCGQVHGLFTNEELDSTLAPLKDVVAAQALLAQDLFSFFTAQVQRNLRIIVSMDPSSSGFQHDCQANPALLSRSVTHPSANLD